MIEQILILFTGVPAIYLSQSGDHQQRRYACLFGLAGQPFWLMSAWKAEQWGILFLSVLYALSWGRGLYVNWIEGWLAEGRA